MNRYNKDKINKYKDDYNNIPEDYNERFDYIIKKYNLTDTNIKNIVKKIKEINESKVNRLEFVINLEPQPTARPRISRFGAYVPHALDNAELFKEFALMHNFSIIKTPVTFKCVTYKKTPTMTKEERLLAELGYLKPISRPDWDNLAKTYCDMIQSSLLLDDSLITDVEFKKRFSHKPRIEIVLEYKDEYNISHMLRTIDKWKII